MKRQNLVWMVLLILLLGLASSVLAVGRGRAQAGDGFDLSWHVLGGAGGSGTMGGSSFTLDGTLAQTANGPAGTAPWRADQGYWYGVGTAFAIYLPVLFKGMAP